MTRTIQVVGVNGRMGVLGGAAGADGAGEAGGPGRGTGVGADTGRAVRGGGAGGTGAGRAQGESGGSGLDNDGKSDSGGPEKENGLGAGVGAPGGAAAGADEYESTRGIKGADVLLVLRLKPQAAQNWPGAAAPHLGHHPVPSAPSRSAWCLPTAPAIRAPQTSQKPPSAES